jgi:formylglycine-generating enzyme required for sulfatase activity
MGCSPLDSECSSDEKPQKPVTIRRGFWIGQTPVTVAAFARYAQGSGKSMPPEKDNEGRLLNAAAGDTNMPIVSVTWNEAVGFCEWSGKRLPTEEEWEWAARAGTKGPRYGDLDKIAWYADNSGRTRIDSSAIWSIDPSSYDQKLFVAGDGPHPVGQLRPNGWGLFDMLGNVWQWTAQFPGSGSGEDEQHALRGGSWPSIPAYVRVSFRLKHKATIRNSAFGFRCVSN